MSKVDLQAKLDQVVARHDELAAIMSEGGKRFVWVAKGLDKVLERRESTIEDGVGETLRAITGLKAGETIVAAGGNYFREGDKVRPWGE